jgi:hypothetical protein
VNYIIAAHYKNFGGIQRVLSALQGRDKMIIRTQNFPLSLRKTSFEKLYSAFRQHFNLLSEKFLTQAGLNGKPLGRRDKGLACIIFSARQSRCGFSAGKQTSVALWRSH